MDKTTAIVNGVLDQYRLQDKQAKADDATLGQQQFFELMVTQLKNQDPMKPMESGDFLGQIAQFSTVNGIGELQQSFATLASSLQSNQALQASTMVGREVVFPSDRFSLRSGEPAGLSATLAEEASAVRVTITDPGGQVVRQEMLGQQPAGRVNYTWDGLTNGGTPAIAGHYAVRFDAIVNGAEQALESAVRARVDSVSLSRAGLAPTLNVDGYGTVAMGDVLEIL
ncbi:MAG: flagellar hook assembly protein FlgD [Gammaproteobacteria bacterium]